MTRPRWIVLAGSLLSAAILVVALLAWQPWSDDTSGRSTGPSPADRTAAYLSVARDQLAEPDALLEAAGRGICREFGDGITWTNIITGLISDGEVDARQAGSLVGAAVTALCPQYTDQLP